MLHKISQIGLLTTIKAQSHLLCLDKFEEFLPFLSVDYTQNSSRVPPRAPRASQAETTFISRMQRASVNLFILEFVALWGGGDIFRHHFNGCLTPVKSHRSSRSKSGRRQVCMGRCRNSKTRRKRVRGVSSLLGWFFLWQGGDGAETRVRNPLPSPLPYIYLFPVQAWPRAAPGGVRPRVYCQCLGLRWASSLYFFYRFAEIRA